MNRAELVAVLAFIAMLAVSAWAPEPRVVEVCAVPSVPSTCGGGK